MLKDCLTLTLFAALLPSTACGGGGEGSGQNGATTLTVVIPDISAARLDVEYSVDCAQPSTEPNGVQGTLELSGTSDRVHETASFWKSSVAIPAGDCELDVIARDDDGEAICRVQQTLAADVGRPTDLYLEMICGFCFCELAGDVVLTVDTITRPDPRATRSVTYSLSCRDDVLDEFSDEVVADGSLLQGEKDGDPWAVFLRNLPVGSCDLAVSALDSAGETICAVETTFTVALDTVSQVRVVMSCAQ